MDSLDVLYTIDKKYIDMMLGSILSMIINSDIKNLRFHIITSGCDLSDYEKIENVILKYSNSEICFYDVDSFNIERFNIPNWRGTQIANARLFFQELLDDNLSRMSNLLYIDSDTIVINSLTDLEKYKENKINAVKDGCSKKYIENLNLKEYFNSGVLFFNVEEWIRGDCQDRLIHFIEQNEKDLVYPDQDILNMTFEEEISQIPVNYNLGTNAYMYNYNLLKKYYEKRIVSIEEIEEAKNDPKILHSTGILGIKPWMENNINPFNYDFMKYIYMANPEFKKMDISLLKKILTLSPFLFKAMLLTKEFIPEKVSKLIRKID